MVNFKLSIADPKSGKTHQKEVKDDAAQGFIGMNISDSVKGETFEMPGYELQITGGSDFCGFPMRKGILGVRKKVTLLGGVGYKARKAEKGIKRRKTVCGHKINDKIVQINLKVTKEGSKKFDDIFGKKEEKKEDKKEVKEEKKEAKEETKKTEEKPKGEKKVEKEKLDKKKEVNEEKTEKKADDKDQKKTEKKK